MDTPTGQAPAYYEAMYFDYSRRGWITLPAAISDAALDAWATPHADLDALHDIACALPLTLALTEVCGNPAGLYAYGIGTDNDPGWHTAGPVPGAGDYNQDTDYADAYVALEAGPVYDLIAQSHRHPHTTAPHATWTATTPGDVLIVHPGTLRRPTDNHAVHLSLRYTSIRHRPDLPPPHYWTDHQLIAGWAWTTTTPRP